METIAQKIAKEIQTYPSMAAISAESIVKWAKELGEFLAKRPNEDNENQLTKTQIRKFLDAVIRIKNLHKQNIDYKTEVYLMKPKLAYAVAKAKKYKQGKEIDPVGPLLLVLDPCIEKIENETDFKKFADFVEAIVAYHKYYGGKD